LIEAFDLLGFTSAQSQGAIGEHGDGLWHLLGKAVEFAHSACRLRMIEELGDEEVLFTRTDAAVRAVVAHVIAKTRDR
jgi:hypothetical protein